MTPERFSELVSPITGIARDTPLDAGLEARLNAAVPPGSAAFGEILAACRAAIEAGWMCNREAGGIKYGRVIKPGPATHGFSVDVVDMKDIKGPHHRHPRGEIDLIMPLEPGALFDGRGAGWLVYGPGTAHSPTVSEGRALVLYLLPGGEIDFARG